MSRFKKTDNLRFAKELSRNYPAKIVLAQNGLKEYEKNKKKLEEQNLILDNLIETLEIALDKIEQFDKKLAGFPTLVALVPVFNKVYLFLDKIIKKSKPYIKANEYFIKAIPTAENASKLSVFLRETMAVAKAMGPLANALNVFVGATGLYGIITKLTEINTLKKSKVQQDPFETNKEKIADLESDIKFDAFRICNSILMYSTVPGISQIALVTDIALTALDPANLREWAYMASGFSGGKAEAKKVFNLSTQSSPTFNAKDRDRIKNEIILYNTKIEDPRMREHYNKVVEKVRTNLIENPALSRSYNFKNFEADLLKEINPKDKTLRFKIIDWLNKPESSIIISENLVAIKKSARLSKKDKIELLNTLKKEIEELVKKIDKTTQKKLRDELLKQYDTKFTRYESLYGSLYGEISIK
jgi:hypothetical protein